MALRRWPMQPHCVGLATQHGVLLFDVRCSNSIRATGRCIHTPVASDTGVRSLNFAGHVLSYGTSSGHIYFCDLRTNEHLSTQLDVGDGWMREPECDEPILPDLDPDQPDNPDSRPPGARRFRRVEQRASGGGGGSANVGINNRATASDRLTAWRPASSIPELPPDIQEMNFRFGTINRPTRRRTRRGSADPFGIQRVSLSNFPTFLQAILDSQSFPNLDTMLPPAGQGRVLNVEMDASNSEDAQIASLTPTTRREHPPGRDGDNIEYSFAGSNPFPDLDPTLIFASHRNKPAVYTHEYDLSGTRLFAGGGPIAANMHGNVAVLWE